MPEYSITAVCGKIVSAKNEKEAEEEFWQAFEDANINVLEKTLKIIKH